MEVGGGQGYTVVGVRGSGVLGFSSCKGWAGVIRWLY